LLVAFVAAHSNFFLLYTVLLFQAAFSFHFIALCVLTVAVLIFAAAPYRGLGVRLAGRCPAPAAVFQFGFCSGLDKHR
jgi:uncharacterized membrane protein